MPRNIEIKARVADHAGFLARARELSDTKPALIHQHDTFFHTGSGRLKLRDFQDGRGELIFYERPDRQGPKTSRYLITPTADPAGLREVLSESHGILGTVIKTRSLLLAGRTRIHLDEVEGLGCFMELEVVLAEGEDTAVGEAEARRLMDSLEIRPEDLLTGAYLDLLTGV